MRLAFVGTPAFAVPALHAVHAAGHEIAAVYSQPERPRGRGRTVQPSPVQIAAQALNLDVRTPVSMRDPAEVAAFRTLQLDVAVVVAYGQILTREVLEAPRLGCFNVHASLLPRWRGAAPIQRAIMAGDATTGVQVMRMSEGLDEGAVLMSTAVPIGDADTSGTLHDVLAQAGAALLVRALAAIEEGTAVETAQSNQGVVHAPKIRVAEARIDWTQAGPTLDRLVRGLSPFPGAWFELPTPRGPVRVKALLSRVQTGDGAPGEVLDDALCIACGEGAVRLLRLQREGRAAQDAAEFLRGTPVRAGAVLG